MGKRHEKLGVKQTIQRHWMDRTVQMLLAGLSKREIRMELDAYLATQKQSGGVGVRGPKTYGMAIALLAAWFEPDEELRPFRDDALQLIRETLPEDCLPLHWAMLSAAYPFWFHTARVCGRLFNLQDCITQRQIFDRLREQYGDRESVIRNARYTVRSFVAWGVLKDSKIKGCYEKAFPVNIVDPTLVALLIESALWALPEGKSELGLLLNHPAFFPFNLPVMSGDSIVLYNSRLESVRYALDSELLKLKKNGGG